MRGWVLDLDGFWVAVETKFVFKCDDKASLGAILSSIQLKDEPPIVDEFDWGVSVVDRDPIGLRVSMVVTLVPSCWSLDVCRQVVSGSGYNGSESFSFQNDKL